MLVPGWGIEYNEDEIIVKGVLRMEEKVAEVRKVQVERVIKALQRNQIHGYYVAKKEDVVAKVQELLKEGDRVAVGGSQTLFAAGVIDHLRSGRYTFYDRYQPGLTPGEIDDIHRMAFGADAYLCSCNAVTLSGEIYNVDGNGNRVAATIFGPKRVIMVVGVNKIVRDLEAALERVRMLAAPANVMRFGLNNPCASYGKCANCHEPTRICCSYVTIGFQRDPQRMHVIFVGEELGY